MLELHNPDPDLVAPAEKSYEFLACVDAAEVNFNVSGDAGLFKLKKHKSCPRITAE